MELWRYLEARLKGEVIRRELPAAPASAVGRMDLFAAAAPEHA